MKTEEFTRWAAEHTPQRELDDYEAAEHWARQIFQEINRLCNNCDYSQSSERAENALLVLHDRWFKGESLEG